MNLKILNSLYIKASGIIILINIILLWMPANPLFNIVGGALGVYYILRSQYNPPTSQFLYIILTALINAAIIAFANLLLYLLIFPHSIDITWIKEILHLNYFFYSEQLRMIIFAINFVIAFLSCSFGMWLMFYLRIGKPIESDEKLMSQLSIEELNIFLEE